MHLRPPAALFVLLAPLALAAGSDNPLPEAPGSDTGYPSPEAALTALRNKPGVSIREENDWFVIQDPEESATWSITAPGNEWHPSAVKRALVERDGAVHGASKERCDQLVRVFPDLNEQMTARIGGDKC